MATMTCFADFHRGNWGTELTVFLVERGFNSRIKHHLIFLETLLSRVFTFCLNMKETCDSVFPLVLLFDHHCAI
jgi:hypothetical protein